MATQGLFRELCNRFGGRNVTATFVYVFPQKSPRFNGNISAASTAIHFTVYYGSCGRVLSGIFNYVEVKESNGGERARRPSPPFLCRSSEVGPVQVKALPSNLSFSTRTWSPIARTFCFANNLRQFPRAVTTFVAGATLPGGANSELVKDVVKRPSPGFAPPRNC